MNKAIRLLAGVVLAGALAGCEWQSTPSGDASNTSGYFVNFSGVYRGAPGRFLVSNYSLASSSTSTTTPGTGSGGSTSQPFINESQGTAVGTATDPLVKISGNVSRIPVVAGTVSIFVYDQATGVLIGTFTDNGGGALAGTFLVGGVIQFAGSGEIVYATGAWFVNLALPGIQTTVRITASYRQNTTPESGSSTVTTTSDVHPGSTGTSIFSFTVQQDGSSIKLIDNNGMEYVGSAGTPVFTSDNLQTTTSSGSGSSSSSGTTVTPDGPVTMSFNATGTSLAGFTVNIVGSFNGFYQTDQRLINRTISGTWIEVGGKTGDIYGLADDSTAN